MAQFSRKRAGSSFRLWRFKRRPTAIGALERKLAMLERRVTCLEGFVTPEQRRELELLQAAERIVNIARREGQL